PVRSDAGRVQARPDNEPGDRAAAALVRQQPGLPGALLRALRAVSLPYRHRARIPRYAVGDRAVAHRGERFRAVRLLPRAGLGPVAVHPGHRLALRPEAGLVV